MFSGGYWLVWFNPKPFKRGEALEANTKRIVEMSQNKEKLEDFITKLIDQEKVKRQIIINEIGNI